MIENIKSMYNRMLDETKRDYIKSISEEFDLNPKYVRQFYLWECNIPEERQPRIVELGQNVLKLQEEKTREIVGQ